MVFLPSIDIAPVYPKLSIVHVQTTIVPSTSESTSTNAHSGTHILHPTEAPLIDPLTDGVEPQTRTIQDLQQPAETDVLTQREFFTIMENFAKNLFKTSISWVSPLSYPRVFHPGSL